MVLKFIFQFKNSIYWKEFSQWVFPEEPATWICSQIFLRNTLEGVHFAVIFNWLMNIGITWFYCFNYIGISRSFCCPHLVAIANGIFTFSFNWDSLNARLTATTRHGVTRKINTKRLKHTWNIFRKNLQL